MDISFEELASTQLAVNQICVLPIEPLHLALLLRLPFFHRDPFDRLLAVQTLATGMTLVSADPIFNEYGLLLIR
ncbi:MAG: hypothetical protein WCI05_01095 [Myxococcales bacterium]|jgi:PIN domain nuclease of toxin-antitoxin system